MIDKGLFHSREISYSPLNNIVMPVNDPMINLNLYVDEEQSPLVYWIDSEILFVAPDIIYKEDGHGVIPTTSDENGIFHLDVQLKLATGTPSNPVIHQIDLADFPFTAEEDTLTVHVLDENGLQIGSGIVKSADATHETRPWESAILGS